jgi:dGTPase
VCFTGGQRAKATELKAFLFANLYRHPRVMETTGRAQQVVHELFSCYLRAPGEMQAGYAARSDTQRAVADYIAGMTDRYALREHERLTGRVVLAAAP